MGTPSFAVPSLRSLLASRHEVAAVVTRPDRPSGRGLVGRPSPIKALAVERGLTLLQPEKIRTAAFLEEIRSLAPDALVVVAYGRILPPTLLDAAPNGGINVHASLLPRWRGAAPVAWAIASGDKITGVCTMKMVEKLDAGDVYLRRSMTILPDDTTGSLEARLAEVGATLLIETLDAVEEKTMALLQQNEQQATFAPIIRKEDGRIDWSRPAAEIERRVRAFDPWPVAFTTARGKTLRVWKAGVEEPIKGAAPPDADGRVLAAGGNGLRVSCRGGSGLLTLLEVQPEGRRRMSAKEAAAGRYLAPGDLLGS